MRFNSVQINSIYVTKDGLSGGEKCKLTVSGLDLLKKSKSASVKKALDGTPHRRTVDFGGRGFDISILVETVLEDVFDAVNGEINDAIDNEDNLSLVIAGDTGTFNLTVIPAEEPIRFPGTFINGRIKQVTYSFVTT